MVSNPVDILTHVALKLSGMPENRVIGSGTVLDTARFKYILGEHLGVDPRNVHARIIGEHGDSEIAAWSTANISGIPVNDFCELRGHFEHDESMQRIAEDVKNSAYEIIAKKKATYYGIAMSVKRICEAIVRDEKPILPVSNFQHGVHGLRDVVLSMPAVVGKNGIEYQVPAPLSDDELARLHGVGESPPGSDRRVGFGVDDPQSRHFVRSSQKATALAAATLRESTPWGHGDRTRCSRSRADGLPGPEAVPPSVPRTRASLSRSSRGSSMDTARSSRAMAAVAKPTLVQPAPAPPGGQSSFFSPDVGPGDLEHGAHAHPQPSGGTGGRSGWGRPAPRPCPGQRHSGRWPPRWPRPRCPPERPAALPRRTPAPPLAGRGGAWRTAPLG